MNDEQDRDKGHIKKYYGPPKTNTVEQYAATNLNNNAFANEDSVVKPGANATGKGPSKVMDIKPVTPTGGKRKGEGKKIKTVDTPSPKKENPQIPTFNESAETSNDEKKGETPTVTTPAKEPPSSPPSAEPPKTETQTLARESENKDMLNEPPKEGEAKKDNEVVKNPNTLSVGPTVSNPNTLAREKEPSENGKENTDPDTDPRQDVTGNKQQKEWKPSVTSQRMMDAGLAGLNMFGNVLGGANKAFSMLRGLASALTSRQLMSDPSLPARGFLQAMDQSGQIIEDGIKQVGETYGIKDGVRREDLVGTYKGAQYYREKQDMENAEKDYYGKVGMALSDVLGNNIDVNDPVAVQNALSKMDGTQLSALNERLFGQNGSLKDMYDGLMTASNPTKVQMTQAKLLQGLNKALRIQATSNAREAGLERSEANARARQLRQDARGYSEQDMATYRQAQQQVANPESMAGMSGLEQMRSIIHSAIGRRIMSGDIPMQRSANGQWGVMNTDNLDINALNAIRRTLEGGQIMNHPATQQAARQLYNEVQTKLNNARQRGVQFRQQQRESRLAPYMDSPLEYDIESRGGRRDRFGIPESSTSRRTLYNNAWYTMQDLIAKGGDQKDIALCENVMQMCDMADFREELMNRVRDMEQEGSITPMEAELVRRNAERAYEEMASALPMTRDGREDSINKGRDWTRNQRTDAIYSNMQALDGNLDNIDRYHAQAERERRKEQEQAARDERMRPYQNSPVDLDMNSGSKADRDPMGIPTDKGKRNKLYVKAQNMLRDLRQNNGDQKDIDLCRNVMALCDLADRRDELTNTVRDMRKAGVISPLEEEMYLDEANRYYDLASAELATTVDEREARIAAKENWTENMRTGEMSSNMDELHQMIEDERTGFANQERDRRRAQEQARREAQRSAELQPYQNSPLDLDLRTGKKTNRDRYNIPRTYAGQKALRNNADDMIRTLIDEGGDEKDIALCENVRTLAEAAMQRSEIESYLSRLEAKGKISKEEAELARQNAYRAYNDLAGRLPVTVGDRDARIQAGQDWEQDDATDNLSIDLESTMNHLKYLEGEHDTRVREDREALKEQRRRERAENRARAKEQARQEQDAKAKADWEEQADRDDRGISLAPWNKDNNKYRKKDIADAQVRLAEIEKELESIPIRSDTVSERTKLREEKRDLLTKIRRTCQEDHIQKLIAEAGRFDVTTREELVQKAIELRDTTSNWDEFGKAINDLRDEYKLGPDRAWQSTKRREEGLRRKARDEARIKGMEDIASAIRGTPQQMVDLLSKAFADPKGDLNKGIMNMLKASNIDLKTMLLGSDDYSVRSSVREAIRQAFKMNAKEGLRDLIKDGMKDYMSGIGDSLNGITDAVNDLNDVDKSNIVKGVNNVEKAVTGMADMVAKVFAGDDPDQPMTMKDFRDGVTRLQTQIHNLLTEVNGKIPLGGIGSPQATLDPDTLKALQTQATNLNTLNDNLSALIPTLNGRETLTKEDLKELIKAINAEDKGGVPQNDLEANDLFGGNGIWRSEDDYNRFMDMVDQVRTTMRYVNEDMDRQRAEGVERPGIPTDPIDRLADGIVDEAKQELRQNATEGSARDSPPGSEIPAEREEGPKEVQETATDEAPQDNEDFDEFERALHEKYPSLFESTHETAKMRDYLDSLKTGYRNLDWYLRLNPDSKIEPFLIAYNAKERGEDLHQSYKNLLDNAMIYSVFGTSSAENEEAVQRMMDEMLGPDNRQEAEAVRAKWLGDNPSDKRRAVVENAFQIAREFNEPIYRASMLQGQKKTAEDSRRAQSIKDYFKYLHDDVKMTPEELGAAKKEALRKKREYERQQADQKAWESKLEPTAQALGMDLSSPEAKEAYDVVYRRLLSRNNDVLYGRDRMDNNVKNTYRPALQELLDKGTDESKAMFNKIIDSLIPAIFQQSVVGNGGNLTNDSMSFDPEAARLGLELARRGKLDGRGAELFTPERIFDDWASGRNTQNGYVDKTKFKQAYELGRQVKAREAKINGYYNDIMSGKDFGTHMEDLAKKVEEIEGMASWKDLYATYNQNKNGNERLLAYQDAYNKLGTALREADTHIDALQELYDRISGDYYDPDKLGVTLPPEKLAEMKEEIKNRLAGLSGLKDRLRSKRTDLMNLNSSIKRIHEKTEEELAAEEKAKKAKEQAKKEQATKNRKKQNRTDTSQASVPYEQLSPEEKEAYDTRSQTAKKTLDNLLKAVSDPKIANAINGVKKKKSENNLQFEVRRVSKGLGKVIDSMGEKGGAYLTQIAENLGLKPADGSTWNTNEINLKYIANAMVSGSGKIGNMKYDPVWNPKKETTEEQPKEETEVKTPVEQPKTEIPVEPPKVKTPVEQPKAPAPKPAVTPESVEKTRSELQATVDPDGTLKTPEEAKESIVDYLTDNGGGRDGLNTLAEQLGLKKEGDGVWKFNRPNMRLIADAVVKGWEFPGASSGSEDDEEEEDIMGYGEW